MRSLGNDQALAAAVAKASLSSMGRGDTRPSTNPHSESPVRFTASISMYPRCAESCAVRGRHWHPFQLTGLIKSASTPHQLEMRRHRSHCVALTANMLVLLRKLPCSIWPASMAEAGLNAAIALTNDWACALDRQALSGRLVQLLLCDANIAGSRTTLVGSTPKLALDRMS